MAQENKDLKRSKNYLAGKANARATMASSILAVLGIIILVIWAVTYRTSNQMSTLLLLSGIGVLAFTVLLYFLSPSRFIRDDVCDAMARTDVITLNRILNSLLIESRGIHTIDAESGTVRLFIPFSDKAVDVFATVPDGGIFQNQGPAKGLSILPPGQGLFLYALGIGATFTDEGLENEIRDVLVNGLELATGVAIKREEGLVRVTLRNPANIGLCRSIRDVDADICTRTGCPICSFVACMVAAGTGKNTRIKDIKVDGKTIQTSYELL